MDATQLIRHDHQAIERLFRRMERALGEDDTREIAAALREITSELSVHATIEEQFLYPALRKEIDDEAVLDAIEEHHAVKLTLAELQGTPITDERFAPRVRLLLANVREHVAEEERSLLPEVERKLDPERQRELGSVLAGAKAISPTRPHPSAPEMPPGNLVLGPLVAIVDRLRDALRDGALTVRRFAGSAFSTAFVVLRRATSDAEQRGRVMVDDLTARTRLATSEVREAGRRTVEQTEGRAFAAARQVRARARRVKRGGSRTRRTAT